MKKIKFPQDELAHDNIIEWWYFNGNLKDAKGNQYSFMDCLFKADAKKVNIPFLKNAPFKKLYFSHSLLSDIKKKKFYPKIDYVSLVSKDSFSKPLLFVNYMNPLTPNNYINRIIEKIDKSKYIIKTDDFDLSMTSMKKPLLEGGTGYITLKSTSTYYYSLTNLKTKGTIKIDGKEIKVKGKSWMDHQWADVNYNPKTNWTWFSIQLDNNIELVCFEYGDGKNKSYLATISYENDTQVSAKDVILTPTDIVWQSPVTKAKYPLSWKIEIPSKKISLEVEPLLRNQEMLFGTINYWEGPLAVKGVVNGKKVKGSGFLELVGCPMGLLNPHFYKKAIEETITKSIWPNVKNKGEKFVSTVESIEIYKKLSKLLLK